jgi:hypothetical protein
VINMNAAAQTSAASLDKRGVFLFMFLSFPFSSGPCEGSADAPSADR